MMSGSHAPRDGRPCERRQRAEWVLCAKLLELAGSRICTAMRERRRLIIPGEGSKWFVFMQYDGEDKGAKMPARKLRSRERRDSRLGY